MIGPTASTVLEVRVRWARSVGAAELAGVLLPGEAARIARLRGALGADGPSGAATAARHPDDVASSLVLARLAVAEECGIDARAVVLTRRCPVCGSGTHGRPQAVRDDHGPVPHVSLSRTRGLVAVATASVAVGVDLERVVPGGGPDIERVALAPDEVAALPRSGRAAAALRTWTRKEALLKSAGTGLTVDPRLVVLGPASSAPEVVALPAGLGREVGDGSWFLADVDLGPGYLCAVAVAVPGDTVVRVEQGEVTLRA